MKVAEILVGSLMLFGFSVWLAKLLGFTVSGQVVMGLMIFWALGLGLAAAFGDRSHEGE